MSLLISSRLLPDIKRKIAPIPRYLEWIFANSTAIPTETFEVPASISSIAIGDIGATNIIGYYQNGYIYLSGGGASSASFYGPGKSPTLSASVDSAIVSNGTYVQEWPKNFHNRKWRSWVPDTGWCEV